MNEKIRNIIRQVLATSVPVGMSEVLEESYRIEVFTNILIKELVAIIIAEGQDMPANDIAALIKAKFDIV